MNSRFAELADLLHERCGATEDDVIRTLFALRAPNGLKGIIRACARLADLIDAYPEFNDEEAFPDQEQRVLLIREIGRLKVESRSPLWRRRHAASSRTSGAELCDLLQVVPRATASSEDAGALEVLQIWFAWQIFQRQARIGSLSRYRSYLRDYTEWPDEMDSRSDVHVLYRELLWLRAYQPLSSILLPLTVEHSRQLTWAAWRAAQIERPGSSPEVAIAGVGDIPGLQSGVDPELVDALCATFPQTAGKAPSTYDVRAVRFGPPNDKPFTSPDDKYDEFIRLAEAALGRKVDPHAPDWHARGEELKALVLATKRPDHQSLEPAANEGASEGDPEQGELLTGDVDPPQPPGSRLHALQTLRDRFTVFESPPPQASRSTGLVALRQFLIHLWGGRTTGPDVPQGDEGDAPGAPRIRHRISKPGQRRTGRTVAATYVVDGDGTHDGVAVDLYADPPKEETADEAWTDDPEDEEPVEPDVTLFLLTGNVVSGWYAAKSAAHHIERANAWLRWPVWRMSLPAIQAVLAGVTQGGTGTAIDRRARLLLGLSLISGRSLETVARVELNPTAESRAIAVDPAQHVLLVPAGKPQLKSLARATVMRYCVPYGSMLRLPLPLAWKPLVDAVVRDVRPSDDAAIRAARRLLDKFSAVLAITEKGLVDALKLALLDAGHGDLGLVKVVTDADGVNFNNIVHYTSYGRDEVERRWRSIVSTWAGPLGAAPVASDKPVHVGTPYGFELPKVAQYVAELKERLRAAMREKRWPDVYSGLAEYVTLWIGLATAGRSSREPVPGVILEDGWALIRDKHRPDESTDRYVPLTDAVRAQLAILRNLASAMSLADADFTLPAPGSDHLLLLAHRVVNGAVPRISDLPGNWGRKVVRSNALALSGRFLDAGLGHWVRGRHPWAIISTFPSQAFRGAWFDLQARLERQLGFEVLPIEGLASLPERRLAPPPTRDKPLLAEDHLLTDEEGRQIDELLRSCHRDTWYHDAFERKPPIREAVVPLAQWVIESPGALNGDLGTRAKAVCTWIRTRYSVPLFATRPRGKFQRNWLVSRYEFAGLDYVDRVLLPRVQHDLAHLPAPAVEGRSDHSHKIELGRLIAAAALRGGVANASHLDALLLFLASEQPVFAMGDARVIELMVRSRRAREPVPRTLILEPYLAALVASERERLRRWLKQWLLAKKNRTAGAARRGERATGPEDTDKNKSDEILGPEKRANRWTAALHAYLKSLGLPAKVTLATFLAAVRQRILLHATPLLAAYASGELVTHDLSASELARLAGYTLPASKAPPGRPRRVSPAATQGDDEVDADPEDLPPADIVESPDNLPRRLCMGSASKTRKWAQSIASVRASCTSRKEVLLCAFATYLVLAYSTRATHGRQREEDQPTLQVELVKPVRTDASPRFRAWMKSHLTIVWAGLTGFANIDSSETYLDEDAVQALSDHTEAYFPTRAHRSAWLQFRYYLMDPQADHAGCKVGTVRTGGSRFVSAKILSRTELDRAQALLRSVRSGIGSRTTRAIACRHFELIRVTGARRAEAEQLRGLDVDGDVLRVRPYAGHSLKTPASERVIPAGLFDDAAWKAWTDRLAMGPRPLIAAGSAASAAGANFFDAEAKAIKAGAGDPDFGPHHLRHTKANALLMKVLANTVDWRAAAKEFPWVDDFLPSDAALAALLGPEGQCGQGLQAISMLLGHLHPTTTLKHYIHTLCLALYAYQAALPPISLRTAFANRVRSRATLYRHARGQGTDGDVAYRVRDFMEHLAEVQQQASGGAELIVRAIRRADADAGSRAGAGAVEPEGSPGATLDSDVPHAWHVEDLEAWHRYFVTGEGTPPVGVDRLRQALTTIAQLPTGKRGSTCTRHPMSVTGRDGVRLPEMVQAGLATSHAEVLLEWLAHLQSKDRAGYDWLLDKWLHTSDALEGSMRLDGPAEIVRAQALSTELPAIHGIKIEVEVRTGYIARNRQRSGASPPSRMRIRFAEAEPESGATGLGAQKAPRRWRAAGAVRWVLTWAAARRGESAGPIVSA